MRLYFSMTQFFFCVWICASPTSTAAAFKCRHLKFHHRYLKRKEKKQTLLVLLRAVRMCHVLLKLHRLWLESVFTCVACCYERRSVWNTLHCRGTVNRVVCWAALTNTAPDCWRSERLSFFYFPLFISTIKSLIIRLCAMTVMCEVNQKSTD